MKEREVLDKYGIDSIEYKQWYRDNHYLTLILVLLNLFVFGLLCK